MAAGVDRDQALVEIIRNGLHSDGVLQKTAEISFQDKSEEERYQMLIRTGSEFLKEKTDFCANKIITEYLYDVLRGVQPQEYTLDCGPVEVKEEPVIKLERDIDHEGTSDVFKSLRGRIIPFRSERDEHDEVKRGEGKVRYHCTRVRKSPVLRPRKPAVRVLC